MSSPALIDGIRISSPASATEARPVAAVDSQLAKCESQLTDWIECPSGKTLAGRAKIEALTVQIAKLKAHRQRAEEASNEAALQPNRLRFDGQGAGVDLQV